MKANEYEMLQKILSKHGQIVTITSQRPVKLKKQFSSNSVQKLSQFQCRIGVQYDNMKSVQEKRNNGELPKENQGLKGFEWVNYPYLLKSIKTNELYLRVSKVNSTFVPKSSFTENGKIVDKEYVKNMAMSTEFSPKDSAPDVFNIKLDNIVNL